LDNAFSLNSQIGSDDPIPATPITGANLVNSISSKNWALGSIISANLSPSSILTLCFYPV